MSISISTIRKATSDDIDAVRSTAERFCKRHGITHDDAPGAAELAIEYAIEHGGPQGDRDSGLARLWVACYCRALGFPRPDPRITIAYGHIGYRCE